MDPRRQPTDGCGRVGFALLYAWLLHAIALHLLGLMDVSFSVFFSFALLKFGFVFPYNCYANAETMFLVYSTTAWFCGKWVSIELAPI
jgi:hypothetical protein